MKEVESLTNVSMSSMPQLSKVFLITEFGAPFAWTPKYLENVAKLGEYGWYWKIFTPNKYENVPANVEIVNMTIEEYSDLVEQKLGVNPKLTITKYGTPSKHITDYYIFSGVVFEDYIKDFDFWGITNMDVVYGRLDHYLPDTYLQDCDVFTDDVDAINGVFCLWRNNSEINNLFKNIPDWQNIISQSECLRCTTGVGKHTLFVSDEFMMTEIMRETSVCYKYPPYDPWHSYDRLEQHYPTPKLSIKSDGSLYEHYNDVFAEDLAYDPNFTKGYRGREILFFHFSYSKKWPL